MRTPIRALRFVCAVVLALLAACSDGDGSGDGSGDGQGGGNGNGDGSTLPEPAASPGVTPAGQPVGAASTVSIGEQGGALQSPDGRVTLTIPPGALPGPTTLSIEPISNPAHGAVGTGYRLAPEGLALSTPATLRFHYVDGDLVGSAAALLGVASRSSEGLWRWQGATVDTAARTVAVQIGHFSDWSLVRSFVLSGIPAGAAPAGPQSLSGQYCYGPEPGSAGAYAPEVGYRCDLSAEEQSRLRPVGPIARWVLSAGSITEVDDSGTIICVFPEGVPTTPPITVSVEVADPRGQPLRVQAPVQRAPEELPPTFIGTFNFTSDERDLANGGSGRAYRNTSPLNLTLRPDAGDPLRYRGRGSVMLAVDFHFFGMTCDPISVPVDIDVSMAFDSQLGWPYEIGGFGTYFAQTRCCSDAGCQQQDVSSAVSLPFGACTLDRYPVPQQSTPDGVAIYSVNTELACTVGGSKFTSRADWYFRSGR